MKRLFFLLIAPLAVLAPVIAPSSSHAINTIDGPMVWQHNAFNDPSNKGRYTVTLTYGVPETDNRLIEAFCDPRTAQPLGDGPMALIEFGARERRNHRVDHTIRVDTGLYQQDYIGFFERYSGNDEELVGITLTLSLQDPLWRSMARHRSITYAIEDQAPLEVPLSGSFEAISAFIDDCQAIAESARDTEERLGKSPEILARWDSCDFNDALFGVNPDVEVLIDVTNRAEGERGVVILTANGPPALNTNIEVGDSLLVRGKVGQAVMFTDAPGNCLEKMFLQAGVTAYTITAPNRDFGPE